MPFPALMVRPAAGKQGDGEGLSLPGKRPYVTVACFARKAGLSGERPFHHIKEGIVVRTGKLPASR